MSHIIITCNDDANNKQNCIRLRNGSSVIVELQPGDNVLCVKDYPELKYGFLPTNSSTCKAITAIDLSHFDASELTSTASMFEDMTSLKQVNLIGINFSNVENMNYMFAGCLNLNRILIDSVNAFHSDVLSTAVGMFYNAKSITKLGLGHFGGKSLCDIRDMFALMDNLEALDLSGWNLSKCRVGHDGAPLFFQCKNLKKIGMVGCNSTTIRKILNECQRPDSDCNPQILQVITLGAK